MAITINTNVTSLAAQRSLNSAQNSLATSMERLSSGLRINRASDDAAGLAVSKLMDKQITGLSQGSRNGNMAIAVIANTESQFEEANNNLQRMRELAVQASTGSYSASDRSAMQIEFKALRDEIQRVAVTAEFNGFKLADGTQSSMSVQVGANNSANDRVTINLTNLQTSAAALNISAASVEGSTSAAQDALDKLDTAINTLSKARAQIGADQARLETAVKNNTNYIETLTSARSAIVDVDFAAEVSTMAKNNVLTQAGASMLSQANTLPQMALSLLQ